jgi:dihydrofolate reductase
MSNQDSLSCKFTVIYAVDEKNGFGLNTDDGKGKLPWEIKEELVLFRKLTTELPENADVKENILIMGKNTYRSMPPKLPKRKYLVVTSTPIDNSEMKSKDNVLTAKSLDEALQKAAEYKTNVFVIGGVKLIEDAYKSSSLNRVYQTRIHKEYKCDTYIPDLELDPKEFNKETQNFTVINNGEELKYDLNIYTRI